METLYTVNKNKTKQKTAYEIQWCDWSSDVCSSDLEIRLIILFAAKDGDALYSQQKQDWELAEIGRASCRERV